MARYQVQAPDGSIHEIEGPDNATPDQVTAAAASIVPSGAAASQRGPESQLDDLMRAIGHHILNAGAGVVQTALHAAPQGGPVSEARDWLDKKIAQNEAQYQAQVPNSPGAYLGAGVGEVLPYTFGPGASLEKGGSAIAERIPLINRSQIGKKLVSGGIQGGTIGAVAPVTDQSTPYNEQKARQIETGAAIGVGVPAGVEMAKAGGRTVRGLVEPFTNPEMAAARRVASNVPPEALSGQAYQSPVPGVHPTLAQAYGGNDLVQLEKASRNTPEGAKAFNLAKESNDAARLQQVRQFAGDDQQLQAAVAARKQATDAMRLQVLDHGQPVNVAPLMQQIQAIKAKPIYLNPSVRNAVNKAETDIATSADKSGFIPAGHLDQIRQNINAYLAENTPHGIVGTQEQVGVIPLKDALVNAVESANPGYRAYLATYAQHSVPINTMEAARSILGGLEHSATHAGGTPQLTLSGYSSKLNKALNDAEFGIDPKAEQALKSIQDDLQRETVSNSARLPGSDTTYNLNAGGVYGLSPLKLRALAMGVGAIGGSAVGHPMVGLAAGSVADKVGQTATERVQKALSKLLTNPEEGRAAILAAQQQPVAGPALVGHLTNAQKALLQALMQRGG